VRAREGVGLGSMLATDPRRSSDGQSVRACCVLCGCESARSLELETRIARVRVPGKIVRCISCGLRYLWPRPSALAVRELYSEDEVARWRDAGIAYIGGEISVPRYLRNRLADLQRRIGRTGRLLDVGAGSGAFATYAAESGWQVTATELETAADVIKARSGVEVIVGDLVEIDLPGRAFDVVHMNHVLEHVLDPVSALRRARELLRPWGLLAIEVPYEFADFVFVARRILGVLEPYRVPTQHLWFFTPETLAAMVKKGGFEIVKIGTRREWLETRSWKGIAQRWVGRLEGLVGRGPLIELIARPWG
jgi:2-polyprenyl-3-methyl-5-hydroxy-6-metoxy-1,4-benzoquinol methylase